MFDRDAEVVQAWLSSFVPGVRSLSEIAGRAVTIGNLEQRSSQVDEAAREAERDTQERDWVSQRYI